MDKTKIPEAVTTALNTIKSFAKYLIVPAGVVTFAPDNWLEYIRLLDLKNLWGSWIAVTFFLSVSIIITDFITGKVKSNAAKKKAYQEKLNLEKRLLNLTITERAILKEIYTYDSAILPLGDASVNKLECLSIITRPSVSVGLTNFSYALQPWVQDYLSNNSEYFKEDTNDG